MNQKYLILLVFGLFITITNYAQGIHLGATTSVNVTAILDKGLSDDPRYNSTYEVSVAPIGFQFGWDIGRKFGLQFESILANQQQIYEIIDIAEQVKGQRKLDMQTLQLPLMMKFMGGGNAGARGNFSFGPQLSVLLDAVETAGYDAGTFEIPDDPNWQLPEGATNNNDGTYTAPAFPSSDIYTKEAGDFANATFQIAASFGLDIDLSKHLFLTSQVRINYSISDMRNKDVYDAIASGNSNDVLSSSANVNIGIQLGLHYSFGVTRKFKGQ